MLIEYNYIGRLLKFLLKLLSGKKTLKKQLTQFVNFYQIS